MKITVIGGGAIGGAVAGYLHQAGCDIELIARSQTVSSIHQNGLKISGVRGESIIHLPVKEKMTEPADLVIFATKSQDLEEAYQLNNAFLDTGLILTTQNGVQGDNLLSVHFERERQLSSIVMFGVTYQSPGHLIYNFDGDWILGRPFTPLDPIAHDVAAVLSKAFKVELAWDIMGQKYLKLFVNFNNAIPGLTGLSMQETFADLDLCRLSIRLLQEGVGIVQSAGIQLVSMKDFPKERILGLTQMPLDAAANILNKTLTGLSREPLYGSILQSIMRQKASEIDFINGEVVRLAKHLKVPVPLNEILVDLVHEVERNNRFMAKEEIKKAFAIS